MSLLAFAPEPLPDEPLDGWIERIAHATVTTSTRILNDHRLFNDRALTRDGSILRDLGPDDILRIADIAELRPEQVEHMTLHRWQSLGLVPHKNERGHQGGAWARTRVGRFCPDCLDERDGVHRIHWRTVWSAACVRHNALLSAYDPATRPYGDPIPLTPAHSLPPEHPILRAQHTIDGLLDEPTVPVQSLGVAQSGWQYLSDLGALTRALIAAPNFSSPNGHVEAVQRRTGADWSSLAELFPPPLPPGKSPASHLAHAVRSPALTALAVSTAHPVLVHPPGPDSDAALWWITENQRLHFRHEAARRAISYPLSRALAPARASKPAADFMLRFLLTRHDEQGRRLSPLDPSKLPSSAWTSVVQRPGHASREIEGVAASAALMMIASDRRTNYVLEALGLQHLRSRITADWNVSFDDTPDGDSSFQQLLDLQRQLATHPVPIDYARRRRLFPIATPLGRNTLKKVLTALGVSETTVVPYCASWYVHELLTGSDFLIGSQGVDMFATHRATYRKWRARWQTEKPRVFYEVAETQLYKNNIDEPVAWTPTRINNEWHLPTDDGMRYLDLWATSRRPVRKSSIHTATRPGVYSLQEAVAYACRGEGANAASMRERLRRFAVLAQSPTLTAAAATVGIVTSGMTGSMKVLERDLGRNLIDRSGLRNTLTPDGRKLKALLDKEPTFQSPTTPAAPQPPGHDLAALVAYAFQDRGPTAPATRELLERFAQVVTFGTKTAAATAIGVSLPWLGQQMANLEHIVGDQLWDRPPQLRAGGGGARPLTPLGHKLHTLIEHERDRERDERP